MKLPKSAGDLKKDALLKNAFMYNHVIGCPTCGEFCTRSVQSKQRCTNCNRLLICSSECLKQKVLALSLSGFLLFIFFLEMPFMSLSIKGLTHQIYLIDSAYELIRYKYYTVGIFFIVSVLLLPLFYLLASPLLLLTHKLNCKRLWRRRLCSLLFELKDWLMADVFLLGVLVSLVKIGALGMVELQAGFYAFFALIVCLTGLLVLLDEGSVWGLFDYYPIDEIKQAEVCKHCYAISEANEPCRRCLKKVKPFEPRMLQTCWALLITAICLYVPANLLPIMITIAPQHSSSSTILEGVSLLWSMQSYFVASVILIASIMIPLAKMAILAFLYFRASQPVNRSKSLIKKQMFWFNVTQLIGRWSFIDVFVVALLVALVQMQEIASIYPGPALLPFTLVVALTLLSASAFDTRALWQHLKREPEMIKDYVKSA